MFNRILASQSYPQLQAVFHEYQQMSRRTVEQVINSEFSGDIQDGLLAIGIELVILWMKWSCFQHVLGVHVLDINMSD